MSKASTLQIAEELLQAGKLDEDDFTYRLLMGKPGGPPDVDLPVPISLDDERRLQRAIAKGKIVQAMRHADDPEDA